MSYYGPDTTCSVCKGNKRNNSNSRRDLCGKCYLKMKREYRKRKGIK
jgi:hypothetical protein